MRRCQVLIRYTAFPRGRVAGWHCFALQSSLVPTLPAARARCLPPPLGSTARWWRMHALHSGRAARMRARRHCQRATGSTAHSFKAHGSKQWGARGHPLGAGRLLMFSCAAAWQSPRAAGARSSRSHPGRGSPPPRRPRSQTPQSRSLQGSLGGEASGRQQRRQQRATRNSNRQQQQTAAAAAAARRRRRHAGGAAPRPQATAASPPTLVLAGLGVAHDAHVLDAAVAIKPVAHLHKLVSRPTLSQAGRASFCRLAAGAPKRAGAARCRPAVRPAFS